MSVCREANVAKHEQVSAGCTWNLSEVWHLEAKIVSEVRSWRSRWVGDVPWEQPVCLPHWVPGFETWLPGNVSATSS